MIGLGVRTCKNCVYVLTAEWVWSGLQVSQACLIQKVIAIKCVCCTDTRRPRSRFDRTYNFGGLDHSVSTAGACAVYIITMVMLV